MNNTMLGCLAEEPANDNLFNMTWDRRSAVMAERTQAGYPVGTGLRGAPTCVRVRSWRNEPEQQRAAGKLLQPRPEERALARVSKDGHNRDRASGHPSRRRFAPPQDEVCGLSSIRPILLVSWNRS